MSALSDRQIKNLWARLDQLGPAIKKAETKLTEARDAGKTKRQCAPLAATVNRLKNERTSINRTLQADADAKRK
jgi:hypothetical protein